MAQDPPGNPQTQETGVDVFEHEIEELEQSVWKENRIHPLIVVAGAAMIALCLGGAFFLLSGSSKPSERGTSTLITIDVRAPRSGRLSARPRHFEWESTSNTRSYVVTVQEQGSTTDLIVRQCQTNSLDLTEDEMARLVKGGSYSWRVHARSSGGWTVGEGGGNFTF